MQGRDSFSPSFSISYSGEQFPSEEEKSIFGYEPFDVYLKSGFSEIDQPWMNLGAETANRFIDDFNSEYLLVFRYKQENVDVDRLLSLKTDIDEAPIFQHEIKPVSMKPDQDLIDLATALGNRLDEEDTFYFQKLEPSNRQLSVGGYLKEVFGSEITIFPSVEGISEINLRPDNMDAHVSQYSKELKLPKERGSGSETYSERGESQWREVRFDYDEDQVEDTVDLVEELGFEVWKEVLPPTVSPDYI